MGIHFRTARPTDIEQSIPLIYSAAVEAFDYAFGNKRYQAIDFLRSAFPSKGLFGYNNHVVATIEDQVVGIGAFYSGAEFNQLNLGNVFQILKFYGMMGSCPVFACCLQIKKKDLFLTFVV